jgi:amino acid adenylation domain-containing protein
MSKRTRCNDLSGPLDRSKCVFPASSKTPNAVGKRTIKGDQIWAGNSVPLADIPATLKAAWVLTLQCFVVADVFCFGYDGPNNANGNDKVDEQKTESVSALYVLRIDRSEPVKSLVTRFGKTERAFVPAEDPENYEIHMVERESLHHQCNTAISYHVDPGHSNGSPTSESPQQEVSLIITTCGIRLTGFKVDLNFITTQNLDGDLVVELEYRLSHTDEELPRSILNTFQHIFAQVAQAQETDLVHNVDLCPPADRSLIQTFTNNVSKIEQRCLHDMIIDQCRQRPDQLAIRSWDGDMTYGELDNLSLRLASHLATLGVGPEVFVLSCFEKSTWACVARLAILRAGGAYISIHATNPPAYLDSVIIRTKTKILLTDSKFVDQFRHVVPTLVELSPAWLRNLPTPSDDIVCKDVRPDNACLILFTSGSTGTPKGIVQIHSSYATAVQDYARNFRLGTHTHYLHFDDYAFDISNIELLVPLIVGGVCCVPGPMKTVEDLASQIRTLNANIVFLTPTVAIKMEPSDVPGLKTLCVGGEALTKDLVQKWASHSTQVINQYGMGEAAVCCAYNDQVDYREGAKIGRPSSGAIWIVDPASPEKLIPVGGVGEIIIEGPHLSRGYLDATAIHRTEAGFLKVIPRWLSELHPDRPHHRMYRSGDLGRMGRDGKITYLGRKDTILKLDGCRIDALEVEHQARKFLSDKDFIVVDLLGTANGRADPCLTAFLYLEDNSMSTPPVLNQAPPLCDAMGDEQAKKKVEEIQKGIGLTLPRYMIPTMFILMAWIPRTASKKLDRKKMHVLGQAFYTGVAEEMTKDKDYAKRMRVLPA